MKFASDIAKSNPAGTNREPAQTPPHQEPPRVSSTHSGGFTGGVPATSHGMTGGISVRDPKGPDAKIKISGGIG